jgi:hypothetical protein
MRITVAESNPRARLAITFLIHRLLLDQQFPVECNVNVQVPGNYLGVCADVRHRLDAAGEKIALNAVDHVYVPIEEAYLTFDHDEARGVVSLDRRGHGADLRVDGKQVAFVDLFPAVEGEPAQLIFDADEVETPLAKLVLEPGGPVLVVSGDAVAGRTEHTIHADGRDRVYTVSRPAPETAPEEGGA